METRWLKDFCVLAAMRNFSRAAEECNVSQPAFSRRMRMLEEEVGVQLINRQTLPLSLTPAGEVFLAQSNVILRTYEETLERCQTLDNARNKAVRFATTQSLYLTQYQERLAPVIDKTDIDIDLKSTGWSAEEFVSALKQQYCDLILCYWHPSMDFLSPLETTQFEHLVLEKDRLIPVCIPSKNGRNSHLLPGNSKKPVPYLSYNSTSSFSFVITHILRQKLSQASLLPLNKNALTISVKAMIMQGFGMGWLPQSVCQQELDQGLLVLAGDESYTTDIEIRLYKDLTNEKAGLNQIWNQLVKTATRSGEKAAFPV